MRNSWRGGVRTQIARASFMGLLLAAVVLVSPAAARAPVSVTGTNLGVSLATTAGGLFVSGVTNSAPIGGLQVGDKITAVNGRRVATAAAFLNRLAATGNSGSIMIFRSGQRQQLTAGSGLAESGARSAGGRPPVASAGWLNPSIMVITSQGVMHRDAAARRGLSGTTFPGTPDPTNAGDGPQ